MSPAGFFFVQLFVLFNIDERANFALFHLHLASLPVLSEYFLWILFLTKKTKLESSVLINEFSGPPFCPHFTYFRLNHIKIAFLFNFLLSDTILLKVLIYLAQLDNHWTRPFFSIKIRTSYLNFCKQISDCSVGLLKVCYFPTSRAFVLATFNARSTEADLTVWAFYSFNKDTKANHAAGISGKLFNLLYQQSIVNARRGILHF